MTAANSGSFEQQVLDLLGGIENRLEGVETRLDGVETRLDGVENRLKVVEDRDRWDERAWRVIAFAGTTSITISVAVGIGFLLLIVRLFLTGQ